MSILPEPYNAGTGHGHSHFPGAAPHLLQEPGGTPEWGSGTFRSSRKERFDVQKREAEWVPPLGRDLAGRVTAEDTAR